MIFLLNMGRCGYLSIKIVEKFGEYFNYLVLLRNLSIHSIFRIFFYFLGIQNNACRISGPIQAKLFIFISDKKVLEI